MLKIIVKDESRGIPPNQVENLFKPPILTQSSNSIVAYNSLLGQESHGLSLTLSKRIAKCLGGDLNYIKQEVGSRFDLDVLIQC